MTKLFFKSTIFSLLLVGMFFTSCQEDDFASDSIISNYEGELISTANARAGGSECFELVFPVIIELSDGTQLSVADKAEFKAAAQEDREANGREVGKPDLIFPVEAIVDGETQSIADLESLEEIVSACKEAFREERGHRGKGQKAKRGGSKCFSINYPVTLLFADGSSVTVDSRETAREAFIAYREANSDATEKPELQFPVSITLADDTTQEIENAEALDMLKDTCEEENEGRRNRGNRCFSVEYPVTFEFSDGSTMTIESREERREAMQAYREANPDTMERPSVQFPITINLEDGTTQSISSEEELEALSDSCDGND